MSESPEVLATGLGHPEGPYVLPDGRVIFANTYRSEIGVWQEGQGQSTFAHTGGGPNACMLGSDGYIYVTQTPNVGAWTAPEHRPPSIQRVSLDGRVEIVATAIDGVRFNGPNDLTFGLDGRLYFTDSGDWDPASKPHPGYIFALDEHGNGEVVEALDHVYPNGIAAEADGSIVWVESYTLEVWRRGRDGRKERLHRLPEGHIPDGLKVAANGDLWITTVSSGGLDVLAPDGTPKQFVETGGVPLNCVFGGTSMYVTDMGVFDTTSGEIGMNGKLVRFDAGVEGMPLFTGAVGPAGGNGEAT
jgi:gluconolactonase